MKKSLLFFLAALLIIPSVADAASNASLQRQIDELKEDMKVLQRKFARSASGEDENVVVQVSQMDETLRQTAGRMDTIEHSLRQLEEKINMINKDIDVRLKMIEGKPIEAGGMSNQNPAKKFDAPVAKGAPASVVGGKIDKGDNLPEVKTKTAEQIYQEGLDAINAFKNDEAIERFTKLLTKHPDSKLAPNAQYWLGEAYYGKKDYTKAAVAFAKGYEKYKNENKGADNLLKLGMAMQQLDKKDEACTAFTSLEKEFPKVDAKLKEKAQQGIKELDCAKK